MSSISLADRTTDDNLPAPRRTPVGSPVGIARRMTGRSIRRNSRRERVIEQLQARLSYLRGRAEPKRYGFRRLGEEPVGHGGWSPIQPTRELSVKVLVVKGGFGSSNSSTAPRAAETRAECPAAGVPTPARSRTRSRERQSSTACAVAGRQFDTGRRNPNRPGLAGSARLVAAALTKVRFESTARARPRSFL